jgi:hypothetical protein
MVNHGQPEHLISEENNTTTWKKAMENIVVIKAGGGGDTDTAITVPRSYVCVLNKENNVTCNGHTVSLYTRF